MLNKYGLELAEAFLILGLLGYIGYLRVEVRAEQAEKAQYEYALSFQNAQIVQNKSDYDEAIKKLPTVLREIDTRYITQYHTFFRWEDQNETSDYNRTVEHYRSFTF